MIFPLFFSGRHRDEDGDGRLVLQQNLPFAEPARRPWWTTPTWPSTRPAPRVSTLRRTGLGECNICFLWHFCRQKHGKHFSKQSKSSKVGFLWWRWPGGAYRRLGQAKAMLEHTGWLWSSAGRTFASTLRWVLIKLFTHDCVHSSGFVTLKILVY